MAVWNYENAAHLLRRAGFGGTPEDVQSFFNKYTSVEEAVADIVDFPTKKKKPPFGGRNWYKAEIKQKQWWLKTMAKAGNPKDALREKMTLFWHSHLCSGSDKVRDSAYTMAYMPIQNRLFRTFANGNFKALVREFNRDPANLYYLDGIVNYATNDDVHVAANENFGREVLELFTVGISQLAADGTDDPSKPNYTEDDVHQLARALTGWVHIEKDKGVWQQWAWDGGQYDDDGDDLPDDVTIFGVTNNNFRIDDAVAGTADDVLELIFSRQDDAGNPQAAMYVCRKLWRWFAYPDPAPGMKALIAEFAAIFDSNNYEVKPVLEAMFTHDEFYTDRAKTRTVMNPADYMVGILRGLGIRSNGKTIGKSGPLLIDMLTDMGMELYEPPNVAGWPGGKRWITTGTLVSRLDFARRAAEEPSQGKSPLKLSKFFSFMGNAAADPNDVLTEIIARLGMNDTGSGMSAHSSIPLNAAQEAELLNFLTDQGVKTTLNLTDDETSDARNLVRGTIALALQSAEAQIF